MSLRRNNLAEWRAWKALRQRCSNPNHPAYRFYGGKGISFDPRWKEFKNFFEDMGKRPSEKHSLDRLDPTKDYGPDNCQWGTRADQGRNKSTSRLFTFNGITDCIAGWGRRNGIPATTISGRLSRGWPLERAIFEQPDRKFSPHELFTLEDPTDGKDRSPSSE